MPAMIRPFAIPEVPDVELEALRARITATRWPDQETVTDDSQGVPLAVVSELARYWAADYDWRRCEDRLGAWPHFMTERLTMVTSAPIRSRSNAQGLHEGSCHVRQG